jgi:hypothetical protein
MMKKLITPVTLICFAITLISACNTKTHSLIQNVKDTTPDIVYNLNTYIIDSVPSESFAVTDTIALFVYPDTSELQIIRKEYGDDAFYTVADDNSYYFAEAIQYLENKKVGIKNPKMRYIKFVSSLGTLYIDSKAKGSIAWTTILFRPDTLPRIISPIDVDAEYNQYFHPNAQ